MDVPSLIAEGEGQTVEFKRSFGEEVLETISAFANADGGVIFVGVDDDGSMPGVQIGARTIEDWANRIQTAIDPRLQPTIDTMKVSGEAKSPARQIGIIKVAPSVSNAVSANGRFLKRVGKTNQRMSGEEIVQKQMADMRISWDAGVQSDASMDDLDDDAIKRFLESVRQNQRLGIPSDTPYMARG